MLWRHFSVVWSCLGYFGLNHVLPKLPYMPLKHNKELNLQLSVNWYPRSILSINVLHWYPWSTLPWLILSWLFIDTSVDTGSTLDWLLGQQSVESGLIFDPLMWVGWHSADYQLTVGQVLIECQSRCCCSVDQESIGMSIQCQSRCQSWIDLGYWSTLDCGCL